MSKLRIPEHYLPGIELLLGLQPEKAEVLSSLMDQISPCITLDEILSYLSDKVTNLDRQNLSKILEFLLSTNDLRVADDSDQSDLVLKISEAIIEKKLTSNQEFQNIDFVQNRLTQFLGDAGELSFISKFRLVYEEHQKVFSPCASGLVYAGSPNISQSDLLELEFYRRAENWKYETSSLSSITKKMRHQDYLKIIEMGVDVLPFILRSLMKEPDHWFVALKSITNEDPISYGASFQDAVNGWLAWGRERDLI
jgi:hypothetical protein